MAMHSRFTRLLIFGSLCFFVSPAGARNYSFPNSPINPTSAGECQVALSHDICQAISKDWDRCMGNSGGFGGKLTECESIYKAAGQCRKHIEQERQICFDRYNGYKNQQTALLRQQEEQERQAREAEQNRQRELTEARTAYQQAQRAELQKAAAIRGYNQRRQQEKAAKINAMVGLASTLSDLFSGGSDNNDNGDSEREQSRLEHERLEQKRSADRQEAARREEHDRKQRAIQQAKDARDKEERSIYDGLVEQVQSAKAAYRVITHGANPFLMETAVASAMPGTEEHANRDYDTASTVIASARSVGMAGNPFARVVSGTAMAGVNSMHRRAFGEMERADQAIEGYTNDLSTEIRSSKGGNGPILRSTPAPSGGGAPNYSGSQSSAVSSPVSFYDPDTRETLEIPAGHVLYRTADSNRIVVVSATQIPEIPTSSDRPELGEHGCSATGIGIVTPECERKRRASANPFRTK